MDVPMGFQRSPTLNSMSLSHRRDRRFSKILNLGNISE